MTKIEKATWIAARPQWYLASIGLTNNVHPYCRLATIAMQTMPKNNCSHRYELAPCAGPGTATVLVIACLHVSPSCAGSAPWQGPGRSEGRLSRWPPGTRIDRSQRN